MHQPGKLNRSSSQREEEDVKMSCPGSLTFSAKEMETNLEHQGEARDQDTKDELQDGWTILCH
jgi:hypothetical protein